MMVNVEVSPREEAWLTARSAEQGLPAADIIKQLIDAQLPHFGPSEPSPPEPDATKALFAQWAKEDATPGLDAKALETIAWLDARIEAGKNASPEERRLADQQVEELLGNLKANRELCG